MATKAKLTLSQFLFRRTGSNNNNNSGNSSTSSNGQLSNNINHSSNGCGKNEFNGGGSGGSNGTVTGSRSGSDALPGVNSHHSSSSSSGAGVNRRMSVGSTGGGGGRPAYFEGSSEVWKGNHQPQQQRPSSGDLRNNMDQRQYQHHPSPQQQAHQQLHGILKKPSNAGDMSPPTGLGGRTHRSSLHRSKSNPNPSNNPLKEVSWSCPTLEKRREVILNYFERIILENKQEQYGKIGNTTTRPNIPCDDGGSGEPIYEEISDFSGPPSGYSNMSDNNGCGKTGSLKPKLGPKKVRMNIPQEHHIRGGNHGQSPIYDKVLCRSQSMLESSTSSSSLSSSSFYDVAPSTTTSISSSGSHHSLYENFRPSTYYASSSSSSCDSDYGTVGGGGGGGIYANSSSCSGKNVTTRMAGRSHSFHDNYRNTGNYNNIHAPAPPVAAAPLLTVDTDQLYAKVCKRKKLKVNNNEHQQPNQQQQQQQHHHHQQRPSPYTAVTTDPSDYCELGSDELHVQVSCGNVVTMIPVMMPCSAASSFSTSCLSLSSSSDNNTDDMTITTSISSINTRNHANHHNKNGLCHYEGEKVIPDKHIAYINNQREAPDSPAGADSCPPSSAAARNRNNLSVIHLLATYNPAKETEEFIPTSGAPVPSFSTAIIDSTDCAPKSISVPVRVNFSKSSNKSCPSNLHSYSNELSEDSFSFPASLQPLMVTNCTFGYDNDAFQDDDDADADDEDNNNNNHHRQNLLRPATTTKDIPSSPGTTTSNSSTSGADDGDCCTSGTSDTDTDEETHHAQKYSFSNNGNKDRGVLKNQPPQHHHHHHRGKSITFQEDSTKSTTPKDLLLLTTSESEDDEELCEHKSLIDMNHSQTTILDESSSGKGDKYSMSLMDDEDRGFDSFLDESENISGESKGESPASFRTENMRNQRTFSQTTQDVPHEQLKKKASSVLDLINSEISDLHMRELELKKLHSPQPPKNGEKGLLNDGSAEEFEDGSSGEDDFSDSAIEYDGFTTNGSHSSGQVSPSENMNEMISQQDEIQPPQPRKPREGVRGGTPQRLALGDGDENEEDEEEEETRRDKVDVGRNEIKVRPLEDDEDRSIKFPTSDETPIEREIRLTKERDEEFRRNNTNQLAVCPPAPTASPKGMSSLPISKARSVSSRPENPSKVEMTSLPISAGATKDIQKEMATARFKKEIEENMKREKEVIRDSKQNKESEQEMASNEVASAQQVAAENKSKEATPSTPKTPTPPQAAVTSESQTQLRKPTVAKLSIAKLPAARFFAPPAFNANKPNRITPVVSPIISKGNLGFPNAGNSNVIGGSLPVGINRPSFTSFEKYILQTSMNYMAKQNGSTPATPASPNMAMNEDPMKKTDPGVINRNAQFSIPTEDPLRIIQKPIVIDETEEGEKEDEEEKPKRRYVPAQDKINQEIQDLAMREKELNRTRGKWKSTLDLPEALKDAEEEKETLGKTTSITTTQSTLSLNTTGTTAATTTVSKDNVVVITNEDAAAGADGNSDDGNTDGESDKLNLTNVTAEDVRQVTRVKAPARRRHSLLINQWEERIRQQQQQNSKK